MTNVSSPRRLFVSPRLIGVVVASVLFAAGGGLWVSSAGAAAQPGSTCRVAGRERVTSAGTLRCTASSGRSLRWVQVAPPPTTTTTTTSSTTTTTTTVAASARAPQVSAISVDDSRVRFTLSGMSPDTGNYAVQWVTKGQSFNTYRMLRVTDKNVSISTAEFACGRPTLTFRVFVMRADWQLADGHQRQNVTPHTDPFDVTLTHACPTSTTAAAAETTTTTAAPLTCATGGTCIVGDTGPGGGTVFYVHPSGTFACGESLTSTCRYLEVSPDDLVNNVGSNPTWSAVANQSSSVSGATGSVIGTGLSNSVAIAGQSGNVEADSAAVLARAYRGGSRTDWYLPSRDELNELCKYVRNTGQAVGGAVRCAGGSNRSGWGVRGSWHQSSTQSSASATWRQNFLSGAEATGGKGETNTVRAVRAFG